MILIVQENIFLQDFRLKVDYVKVFLVIYFYALLQ